ncbi:MarR family winged helix-turn-helix transcriptional regulator [Streptomyces sp. NPDC053079]|uniref:MarR family winged helix-turn-helix transcriptional regulator n=1 Tax=Streptomyces sp. NPDC053079 TaxID=3365697 RepID=UPI0037D463DC
MKPIGYWLNRTDQALTRHMNDMLAQFGLTRTAWQVLNVLHDTGPTTDTDVHTTLRANAGTPALTTAIDTVLTDGWATRPCPHHLALTPEGHQRLGSVAERVEAFRALATTGIPPQEYRTAVHVLQRMTHNLEGAPTGHSRP